MHRAARQAADSPAGTHGPPLRAHDRDRLPPGATPSAALAGRRAGAGDPGPRILADVHELRSGIPEGLASLGATVRVTRLEAGDYALPRDTLVERKRVMDLHTAVGNGRFWPQLLKLRDACRSPYLLIEGTDIDRGPLHPASVRSICLAVIAHGVPVLRSYQQRDSAIWIYRLALTAARPRRRSRPAYAQIPTRCRSAETAESLLAAVPGISTSYARALLARFGTVGDVIAAGRERWLEVPGIGPERASALERAFGGRNSGQ